MAKRLKTLTLKDLTNLNDTELVRLEIKEWDFQTFIKSMSGKEVNSLSNMKPEAAAYTMIILCLCDESGKKILPNTSATIKLLKELRMTVIEYILLEIQKLNKLGEFKVNAVKDAAKN